MPYVECQCLPILGGVRVLNSSLDSIYNSHELDQVGSYLNFDHHRFSPWFFLVECIKNLNHDSECGIPPEALQQSSPDSPFTQFCDQESLSWIVMVNWGRIDNFDSYYLFLANLLESWLEHYSIITAYIRLQQVFGIYNVVSGLLGRLWLHHNEYEIRNAGTGSCINFNH